MLEFVALVSLLRRLSNQGVRRQRILCFCCVEKADPPPGSSTTCCGSLPTSASPPRSPSTCCGSRRGPTWRTRLRGTTLWTAGALTSRPGQRSPGIQCMSPLPSLVDSSSFGNRSLLVQPRCSARVFITRQALLPVAQRTTGAHGSSWMRRTSSLIRTRRGNGPQPLRTSFNRTPCLVLRRALVWCLPAASDRRSICTDFDRSFQEAFAGQL